MGRSTFYYILQEAFGRYLLPTNVISSGLLMGIGDAIEQKFELKTKIHPKGEFDKKRFLDMTLVGFFIGVPQHYFYSYMDKVLPLRDTRTVIFKIFMDQLICSPLCISTFFLGLGVIEHGDIVEGYKELTTKFVPVYKMDICFWPPVQFINFFFLGPKYRVIYVNAMTMIYDVFLSYLKFIHEPVLPGIQPSSSIDNSSFGRTD